MYSYKYTRMNKYIYNTSNEYFSITILVCSMHIVFRYGNLPIRCSCPVGSLESSPTSDQFRTPISNASARKCETM